MVKMTNFMLYRYPPFSKVSFTPLCFYERPTSVPVFIHWKKSQEDFQFYEKRGKANITFSICFAASCCRGSVPTKQWCHQAFSRAPSLGPTLSISALSHQGFELCLWASVLYPDLFHESISEMCPEASEKPKRLIFEVWECSKCFP